MDTSFFTAIIKVHIEVLQYFLSTVVGYTWSEHFAFWKYTIYNL